MKIVNVALVLLIIAGGSALAYYFAKVEMPVVASEHEHGHGGHGDEHGEEGHKHSEEEKPAGHGDVETEKVEHAGQPEEHAEDDHGGHEHGDDAEHAEHAEKPGEAAGKHEDHADEDADKHEEHGEEHAEEEHSHDDAHEHGEEEEAHSGGHSEEEEDGHEHGHGSEEHGHEDGAQHAEIDEATAAKHGLKFAVAESGVLQNQLTLPGEIALDANRVVHVVPRLSGVAQVVSKNLGDSVTKGEVLARIDSRELAEVKSGYLSSVERRSLAQIRYTREKELFDKKITPAEDFLSAKQALAEESINIRAAEQQLQALGLTPESVRAVLDGKNASLTDYPLVAPIDGKVIEKHLNTGEFVDAQADAFVLADLSQVWVSVVVYAADLKNIREGQEVLVRSDDLGIEEIGEVAYIGALVGEQTRTAKATVELDNSEGRWVPGLFVSVAVTQDQMQAPLVVPLDSVQTLKDDQVVFVREGDAIEARPVKLGRDDGKHVEVLSGLETGESYVSENSFLVKADIEKAGAAHEH